jgi:uncharacterized tellurite resistance protein B-like protein
MNRTSIISKLYFLLVYADGSMNEKEVAIARQMIKAEGVVEDEFNVQMQILKSKDNVEIYADAVFQLKQLEVKDQIRIIAWMCVVANADGFMDRNEWQLIYRIYHKELGLVLSEIFAVQKELNRLAWEKASLSTIL